jgi:hypothetical protein
MPVGIVAYSLWFTYGTIGWQKRIDSYSFRGSIDSDFVAPFQG